MTSREQPSRKRPRSEDASLKNSLSDSERETHEDLIFIRPMRPLSVEPDRDDKFWYKDGNVVLVAGNVAFRVYRGLLASQSTVLDDLCSADPAWHVDGCPVVHMSDRAEEVRSLLSVLINGKTYITKREVSFEDLAIWIRLAHKYRIADLLENSLRRPSLQSPHHSITAVNLARLTETSSILPLALYDCCQLPVETLLNGHTYPGGRVEKLSADDVQRCIQALSVLGVQRTLAIVKSMDLSACGYSCRFECADHVSAIKTELLEDLKSPGCRHPLCSWARFMGQYNRDMTSNVKNSAHPMCPRCIKTVIQSHGQVLLECWKNLPELLGIEVEGWATAQDA
ncbi:uncharacterized protein B0H18DRAFT_987551 [Fomitopsis serialis]|uniref:uncharacterized protein n=1 Tax=Fomitopsis serialis TaxID=139415 RepID=UPI002008706D|nr:uncharacterized protein B0H18DRAFT_987551 [Neoantrodia serialis]KAH9932318.1 hypothetical protein B0H18DRAFT_987551 [Neoantrodia serialis]